MSDVQAPSVTQWQYMFVNKQVDNYMLTELTALGKGGWELVSMSYDKDLKGIWGWTAWLKRPLAAAGAGDAAAIAAGVKLGGEEKQALAGFDLPEGDFEFKDEA